jgi:nucleoside-diphosphate-sugar epimerase
MATVLVTGGTGLVGKALQHVIETEPVGSKYGKQPNETWIFASSADGDLRSDLLACLCSGIQRNSLGIRHKR